MDLSNKQTIIHMRRYYEKVEIQKVTFPEFIETIDPDNIYSESNRINTAQLISKEFDFDVRQGKYYIDALRYLNLVDRDQKYGEYGLTERGFETLNVSINF